MRDEKRSARQTEIECAAYAVLEEKGFEGASMLTIARAAKASNETLYNWYGDKVGLFRTLVERNAEAVKGLLESHLADDAPPLETLAALGPELLALLTGPRAVALNRAAAADRTGVLGAALAEIGRGTVAPLIGAVLERARTAGVLAFDETGAAVELYLGLLVGDLQIRRVIGTEPAPSAAVITARSTRAQEHLHKLCAPESA